MWIKSPRSNNDWHRCCSLWHEVVDHNLSLALALSQHQAVGKCFVAKQIHHLSMKQTWKCHFNPNLGWLQFHHAHWCKKTLPRGRCASNIKNHLAGDTIVWDMWREESEQCVHSKVLTPLIFVCVHQALTLGGFRRAPSPGKFEAPHHFEHLTEIGNQKTLSS